jgi:cytosine deaminase
MLLANVRLVDGCLVDVRLDGPCTAEVDPAGTLSAAPGEDVHDLTGYVLLPAAAEPHAHLDKALTADQVRNPRGDLRGAVDAWHAFTPRLGHADMVERATRAAGELLAAGATAIRTHVNLGAGVGRRALAALLEVREAFAGRCELQIVAMIANPLAGPAGREHRKMLADALAAGADIAGGAPHLDQDPAASIRECLAVAADIERPVDLHMDETTDPEVLHLPLLADLVQDGFAHPVTASHCVSLGMQPVAVQTSVAGALAATGIGVVTLPQTNLYLQGRRQRVAQPRGLTAIPALRSAGVTVAAGADNIRDPFNPVGRADPLETAALLVVAAHLSPADAYQAVSGAARKVMGLAPVEVEPGQPAELLAIRADSFVEAIGAAAPDRMVFHAGRLVSSTRVERWTAGPLPVQRTAEVAAPAVAPAVAPAAS